MEQLLALLERECRSALQTARAVND